MAIEEFTKGPRDLPGQQVMPVDEIGVAEWSPGSVDQDVPPTQVHITFSVADLEFAIRLKTRERAEWLCATIMKHAENVWPKRT